MKKFLLSLAVLFAGVASAQSFYMEGERLSEFSVGTKYLLGSDEEGGRYLSEDGGNYLTEEIPTEAALIEFEAAGKSEAGDDLYYIKFSTSGKYVADQEMWDGWDLSDMLEWKLPYITVTDDATKAAKWTVLPADSVGGKQKAEIAEDGSHVANWRVWTNEFDGDTVAYENSWVIMRDRLSDPNPVEDEPLGGQNAVYLEVQGQYAFFAMWGANSWYICQPEALDADGVLGELLEEWVEANLGEMDIYLAKDEAVGSNVGQYTKETFDPFFAAYQAYEAYSNQGEGNPGEIFETLKTTYAALEVVPLTEGYYYIHNYAAYNKRMVGLMDDGFVYSVENGEVPVDTVDNAVTATLETAPYLWYLTPSTEKPGAVVFQHVATKRYVGTTNGDFWGSTVDVEEAEPFFYEIVAVSETGESGYAGGCLYLYGTGENGNENTSWNQQNHSDWKIINNWKDRKDKGNQWKFVSVAAEKVLPVLDAAVQAGLNKQLAALYGTAVTTYNGSKAYKPVAECTLDDDFTSHGYLHAEKTAEGDTISNFKAVANDGKDAFHPTDGTGMFGMVDGVTTTYGHTYWSGSQYPHSFEIDLGEGNELDAIALKTIPRRDSDHNSSFGLGVVGVYARNSVDAEWELVNELTLTYNINLYQRNEDGTVKTDSTTGAPVLDAWTATENNQPQSMDGENFVGVGACNLGGDKYRYLKLQHKTTKGKKNGSGKNENTYTAIAELALFGAEYDPANSMLELVPAEVVETLLAEIANAKAAIAAQNATEEGIAALQAAYDAFIENYPVPARLTQALTAMKTFAQGVPVENEVGFYPTTAKAALDKAIAEVEATVKNVMPIADIEAGIAKLDAAKAAFMKTLIMPESGYYQLYIGAANYNNAVLYASTEAVNTEEQKGVMAHFKKAPMDTTIGKPIYDPHYTSSLSSVWQVEVQGTQMSFRSVANGLYLQKNLGNGTKVQLAPGQVFFDVQADGVKNGELYNFVVGQDSVSGNTLFANINSSADSDGGQLVSWHSATGADNSTFRMKEVKLEDFEYGQNFFVLGKNVTKFITLPYDAYWATYEGYGKLFEPIGFLELEPNLKAMYFKEVADYTEIKAGQAYLVRTRGEESVLRIDLEETVSSIDAINYSYEPVAYNGIQGTIFTTEIGNDYGVFGYGGLIVPSANTENEEGEEVVATIAPFSGYIAAGGMTQLNEVPTSEDLKIVRLVTRYSADGLNAIEGVETIETTNTGVYTLSGVRLNSTKNLPAGIYIINGKKVVK